jgi:hypothetical protein
VKKIYLLLGLAFISTNVYPQKIEEKISIDLPCYNTKEIFKSLREQFKEFPILTGDVDDEAKSKVSIWMNPIELNWTIIATKKDISCVIGVGTDLILLNYKKGTAI